ncbi:MAG: DUF2442 domain-containing protein [bacterium]
MNTSVIIKSKQVFAVDVFFSKEKMHVQLSDGREIIIPIEWFPKLRNATEKQKNNWRLIGKGIGIHWKDIDEDLSVENLL